MPTRRQLHLIWEAQLEMFGGSGQPKQNYEASAINGFTTDKDVDKPIIPPKSLKKGEGDYLGELAYDKVHDDLKVVAVNPS